MFFKSVILLSLLLVTSAVSVNNDEGYESSSLPVIPDDETGHDEAHFDIMSFRVSIAAKKKLQIARRMREREIERLEDLQVELEGCRANTLILERSNDDAARTLKTIHNRKLEGLKVELGSCRSEVLALEKSAKSNDDTTEALKTSHTNEVASLTTELRDARIQLVERFYALERKTNENIELEEMYELSVENNATLMSIIGLLTFIIISFCCWCVISHYRRKVPTPKVMLSPSTELQHAVSNTLLMIEELVDFLTIEHTFCTHTLLSEYKQSFTGLLLTMAAEKQMLLAEASIKPNQEQECESGLPFSESYNSLSDNIGNNVTTPVHKSMTVPVSDCRVSRSAAPSPVRPSRSVTPPSRTTTPATDMSGDPLVFGDIHFNHPPEEPEPVFTATPEPSQLTELHHHLLAGRSPKAKRVSEEMLDLTPTDTESDFLSCGLKRPKVASCNKEFGINNSVMDDLNRAIQRSAMRLSMICDDKDEEKEGCRGNRFSNLDRDELQFRGKHVVECSSASEGRQRSFDRLQTATELESAALRQLELLELSDPSGNSRPSSPQFPECETSQLVGSPLGSPVSIMSSVSEFLGGDTFVSTRNGHTDDQPIIAGNVPLNDSDYLISEEHDNQATHLDQLPETDLDTSYEQQEEQILKYDPPVRSEEVFDDCFVMAHSLSKCTSTVEQQIVVTDNIHFCIESEEARVKLEDQHSLTSLMIQMEQEAAFTAITTLMGEVCVLLFEHSQVSGLLESEFEGVLSYLATAFVQQTPAPAECSDQDSYDSDTSSDSGNCDSWVDVPEFEAL
eukprot:TRINITY_DN1796_c0_g2_i1.p1 TRINITY_DN1796_c0_g2~~TRINITY_DN1796_c0_g2_i1.p1  ORF type:complete len:794 (+),score=137.87 TRINITY_DN1796_c0_g2_i1:81-2462(+)